MEMEKKINGKTIYQGHVVQLDVDQVEVEENHIQATREVVRHHGGVGILAMIDDKILLVNQFRYAMNEYTLEIPAGKIELGEDPYETGMREIEEETGYRAKDMKLFTQAYPTPGYCTEVLHLYEAIGLEKVEHPKAADEDEFIRVIEMPLEEAYQKVLSLEIKDAKTIISILYAYQKKS